MATVNVIGAAIGRQFIGDDPNRYEWRVSYERDGRGLFYHSVSSRDAQSSRWSIRPAIGRTGPYTSKNVQVTRAPGVGRPPSANASCTCCQPAMVESDCILRANAR